MGGSNRSRPLLWRTVELHRPISLMLVLAAPLVGFALSAATGAAVVGGLIAAQLLIAGITWYVGEARAGVLESERIDSRQETLLVLGDLLEPVMIELATTTSLPRAERQDKRSGLVALLLSAATGLSSDQSRVRSCYFCIEPGARPRRMRHVLSVGRAVPASAEFVEGTPAGDAALGMVDAAQHLFCDDVEVNPPPGWVRGERGDYETFIAVTVGAGARRWGMLTIDSVEAGSLTIEDVHIMRVLGHVLGMVEAATS